MRFASSGAPVRSAGYRPRPMAAWRPSPLRLLVGLAGFALVLLMFGVNWYELKGPAAGSLGGFDAWQAFSALDILLFAAGVLGVTIAVRGKWDGTARALGAITALLALAATVLLAIRISDPPTFSSTLGSLKLTREAGAYAGLAAVALLGAAAALVAARSRA